MQAGESAQSARHSGRRRYASLPLPCWGGGRRRRRPHAGCSAAAHARRAAGQAGLAQRFGESRAAGAAAGAGRQPRRQAAGRGGCAAWRRGRLHSEPVPRQGGRQCGALRRGGGGCCGACAQLRAGTSGGAATGAGACGGARGQGGCSCSWIMGVRSGRPGTAQPAGICSAFVRGVGGLGLTGELMVLVEYVFPSASQALELPAERQLALHAGAGSGDAERLAGCWRPCRAALALAARVQGRQCVGGPPGGSF